MAIVTVAGASNSTVALAYNNTGAAYTLANQLAAVISQSTNIVRHQDTQGAPPTVPSGSTGQWVQTQPGLVLLPTGYVDLTVAAAVSVSGSTSARVTGVTPANPNGSYIFGSGAANEAILLGNPAGTTVTFQANTGSGSVAGGVGDNKVIIGAGDSGTWTIALGDGNDTVNATGSGLQIVDAGGGNNRIVLGAGPAQVTLNGDNTVFAGSGPSTITAAGDTRSLVQGAAGNLTYVGGAEAATVFGGSGSDTFFGGTAAGTDVFKGGTHQDTFVVGAGSETVTGGTGANVFDVVSGTAGGHELITNFTAAEQLTLQGYAAGSATITTGTSSTVITLSDNTQITLQNFTGLKAGNITYT